MKNLSHYVEQAVQNIEKDRATTETLLIDVMIYLKKNDENHKTTGMVVAKYLESLQRSNEQLLKIANIIQKSQVGHERELEFGDHEKEDLFEQIKRDIDTEG